MAVMFFLLIGMIYWFLLVSKIYDPSTALLSLLFWLMNPFIYKFSQQILLEIPTLSMCIVCVYYFFKFESNSSVRHAVILGIVVGLTLWTNQKRSIGWKAITSLEWKMIDKFILNKHSFPPLY